MGPDPGLALTKGVPSLWPNVFSMQDKLSDALISGPFGQLKDRSESPLCREAEGCMFYYFRRSIVAFL